MGQWKGLFSSGDVTPNWLTASHGTEAPERPPVSKTVNGGRQESQESSRERPILRMRLGHFCSLFSSLFCSHYKMNPCHEDMSQWTYWYEGARSLSSHSYGKVQQPYASWGQPWPPLSCVHCAFLAFHKPENLWKARHSLSLNLLNSSETLCVAWFLPQVYISNPSLKWELTSESSFSVNDAMKNGWAGPKTEPVTYSGWKKNSLHSQKWINFYHITSCG